METKATQSFNYFDFSSLKNLKGGETKENQKENLQIMAKQLESVFLEMVLKGMNDTIKPMKSDLMSSDRENFYQEMLNQQLALTLSKAGGIGLAEMIVSQFTAPTKNDPFSRTSDVTELDRSQYFHQKGE